MPTLLLATQFSAAPFDSAAEGVQPGPAHRQFSTGQARAAAPTMCWVAKVGASTGAERHERSPGSARGPETRPRSTAAKRSIAATSSASEYHCWPRFFAPILMFDGEKTTDPSDLHIEKTNLKALFLSKRTEI